MGDENTDNRDCSVAQYQQIRYAQNQALVLHNIYSEFTKIKFLLFIYNQGYQYILKVALPLIGQFIIQWSNNSQYIILVIVHCYHITAL